MSLVKIIANILINDLLKHSNDKGVKVDKLGLPPDDLCWLAQLVEYEILDRTKVSKVIDSFMTDKRELKDIITKLDLWPKYEDSNLDKIVDDVMAQNQKAVQEIKDGKNKAIGFLIGKLKQIDKNVDTKEAIELIREKTC